MTENEANKITMAEVETLEEDRTQEDSLETITKAKDSLETTTKAKDSLETMANRLGEVKEAMDSRTMDQISLSWITMIITKN